jgi:hypothetical protein
MSDGPNTGQLFRPRHIPARFSQKCAYKMVGVRGFEPRTSSVSSHISSQTTCAWISGYRHIYANPPLLISHWLVLFCLVSHRETGHLRDVPIHASRTKDRAPREWVEGEHANSLTVDAELKLKKAERTITLMSTRRLDLRN